MRGNLDGGLRAPRSGVVRRAAAARPFLSPPARDPQLAMTKCSPSYHTEIVNHTDPGCMRLCSGVSFTVNSVTTGNESDGSCTFSWNLSRSDGASMTGSATVPCGGQKVVDFFCDSGGACVGFKLHLSCTTLAGNGTTSGAGQ